MNSSPPSLDEIRFILGTIRSPERLDEHPWTKSLLVSQAVIENPALQQKSPGYRLIAVLSNLFRQTMPSTPPKLGKRLDTRWCQFGMLAAEFFAPFLYGTAYPTSLRDAWGRIDQSIPFFVFGKSDYELTEKQVSPYRLFKDDLEPAPISTLSDWHTKGLQNLFTLFIDREQHLSQELSRSSPLLYPLQAGIRPGEAEGNDLPTNLSDGRLKAKFKKRTLQPNPWAMRLIGIVILAVLSLTVYQGMLIYRDYKIFRNDLNQIQTLLRDTPNLSSFSQAGQLISVSRKDITTLESDVKPFLWMGKYLAWLPKYGGDLAQAETLLDISGKLLTAADKTIQAVNPLIQRINAPDQHPKLPELITSLTNAQPDLSNARTLLDEAVADRNNLDVNKLSPQIRDLITGKLDTYLPLLQQGLAFSTSLPGLMGVPEPRTYLILFQNEDELRATGGFITAVGTVAVKDGKIISFNVENSYALDDLTRPYPPAPWQLERYMDAYRWLLRDSNWSPDFPTSAALAEYLYAYTRFHSADGIIAIDQHAVQILLTAFGPVNLDGVPYPITAENVIEYIRSAKYETGDQVYDPAKRKDFIGGLGKAILAQLESRQDIPIELLSRQVLKALAEKHILIQLDDPAAAALLAAQGWDGAIRPGAGDFLMVVDSNIGFTKSNAVVESQLSYNIDLSNPASPTSTLKVSRANHATGNAPCLAGANININLSKSYQQDINLCYWDYLRVYGPAGMQLLGATPHAIPGEMTLDGGAVSARVDVLEEKIPKIQAFGTLFVVPVGASVDTDFQFLLPPGVLQAGGPNQWVYQLQVQKQPGTLSIPIHICIKLPDGSTLSTSLPIGEWKAPTWCLAGNMLTDLAVRLDFVVPSTYSPPHLQYATITPAPTDLIPTQAPTPTQTVTPTKAPIGTARRLIIYQVQSGETLAQLASQYVTTEDAIKTINYRLPSPLVVNSMIVIPVNYLNVKGLPVFEVYQVSASISLADLAHQFQADQAVMALYNGVTATSMLSKGRWVLIPHIATAAP